MVNYFEGFTLCEYQKIPKKKNIKPVKEEYFADCEVAPKQKVNKKKTKRLWVSAGTMHPARKNIYQAHFKIFKLLHTIYNSLDNEVDKVYIIRNLEASVEETGIRGQYTGLISAQALESKVKKSNKEELSKKESISTEHPITYRNIAKYLLELSEKPTAEYYFNFWLNNLITVKTTFEENIMLKDYQASFNIIKDDWKKMYKKAGVILLEEPKFNSFEVKKEYGVLV